MPCEELKQKHHIEMEPTPYFNIGGPVHKCGGDIAIASVLSDAFPETVFRIGEDAIAVFVFYLSSLEMPDGRRIAIGPERREVAKALEAAFPGVRVKLPIFVRTIGKRATAAA